MLTLESNNIGPSGWTILTQVILVLLVVGVCLALVALVRLGRRQR